MTDNQQRWLWVIAFIVLPLIWVHLFSDSYTARLVAIIWLYTLSPIVILLLAIFTKQTIKLENYSNPKVELRLSLIARGFGVLLSLFIFFNLTCPILIGTYKLVIEGESMRIVEDSITGQSTAVLAPGIYLGLKLSHDPDNSYAYYFPTMYRFGDSKHVFEILPGTDLILSVTD